MRSSIVLLVVLTACGDSSGGGAGGGGTGGGGTGGVDGPGSTEECGTFTEL